MKKSEQIMAAANYSLINVCQTLSTISRIYKIYQPEGDKQEKILKKIVQNTTFDSGISMIV